MNEKTGKAWTIASKLSYWLAAASVALTAYDLFTRTQGKHFSTTSIALAVLPGVLAGFLFSINRFRVTKILATLFLLLFVLIWALNLIFGFTLFIHPMTN